MHKAYEAFVVVENYPLEIESIESYDDKLLIGSRQGHLLLYNVVKTGGQKVEATLIRSMKSFAKKPITQIKISTEFNLLIILSDNTISVHDSGQSLFPLITTLPKTRGATLFATSVRPFPEEDKPKTLVLAVVVKKKIQIYYWTNDTFKESLPYFNLPDTPLAMDWCDSNLFIGFKTEYNFIKMKGELKPLFLTGQKQYPTITALHNQQMALGRDEQSIFVYKDGNPASKYALLWSDSPYAIVQDYPYLIALLKDSIEVQTTEPKLFVQKLELANFRFISRCSSGKVYVANRSSVWFLHFLPFEKQIDALLKSKQFELALILGEMEQSQQGDADTEMKKKSLFLIYNQFALDLFNKRQFKKALKIFFDQKTDPVQVIGLFPKLLPDKFPESLKIPSDIEPIQECDLETAILALTEFLTDMRTTILVSAAKQQSAPTSETPGIAPDSFLVYDMISGNSKANKRNQVLQIIDTSLLKCYLMTNDALVAPFLRVKDNFCHLEETERALRQQQKYSELVILYKCKGFHKKALELLKKHNHKSNSPLRGHDRTITYLQNLGAKHLDLIFEFARWVLEAHPEDGLRIFTEDLPETKQLPRQKVFDYLTEVQPSCVIPYLEHVITEWKDKTPLFHNQLIHCYLNEWNISKDWPEKSAEIRDKLINFLRTSDAYALEAFPHKLFNFGLYEEAALVMERLGSHQEALITYMHFLYQPQMAEEYCLRNYKPDHYQDKDVFILLLKLYLGRKEMCQLSQRYTPREDIPGAVTLLNSYPTYMDPLQVLPLLPSSLKIQDIHVFLKHVLDQQRSVLHKMDLLHALCLSENIQVKGLKLKTQAVKVTLTEMDYCRVCLKKMGTSAFVRFPDTTVVHYSCRDKYFPL